MGGKKQHYLPAALIGGFGIPAKSRRLREATVVVRRKPSGKVSATTAESIGFNKGTYRLKKPPKGIDQDIVDKLWEPVETPLPDLIARLENKRLQPGDDELLFSYAATAAVRHPKTFEATAVNHQLGRDLPIPKGDEIQYLRVDALNNQLKDVRTWRWRVLHIPGISLRFMLSDRGWHMIKEEFYDDQPQYGIFLPMSPKVAILGYLDSARLPDRRPPFDEHFDLCESWIEWFNSYAWWDWSVDLLIAHPDDRERLANLPDHRKLTVNSYGPFMKRLSLGLFD